MHTPRRPDPVVPLVRESHVFVDEEPLLWAADAIAWCWQRGGVWKDKVRGLVVRTEDLSA